MPDEAEEKPFVDLQDPQTNECPYPAYQQLRDNAPVYFDERTQMYVLTRFEDVRRALTDTKTFSNARRAAVPRWHLMEKVYTEKGWVPGTSLGALDNPAHKQQRALFNDAFRPARINTFEPYVVELANQLIDAFADAGQCEFVSEFAVPLPLAMIGRQMGVPDEDMMKIKRWTDSWIQRRGMMMTDEEIIESTELEVEAQHYFQPIFERLRKEGDGTVLSDLVRTEIPEWGRTLNDNELHAEMMADMFVGGAETATSALANGVKALIERPDVWAAFDEDPDKAIPAFIEELLRVESPVQGLFRRVTEDIELHGVRIPAGSMVNVRYGAANRDERNFPDPESLDLERTNARQHLAFGQGTHMCLGAPLARLELRSGLGVLRERLKEMWFIEGANDFAHRPNFVVRGLRELHIGFTMR
jgi:cytochrome P450